MVTASLGEAHPIIFLKIARVRWCGSGATDDLRLVKSPSVLSTAPQR